MEEKPSGRYLNIYFRIILKKIYNYKHIQRIFFENLRLKDVRVILFSVSDTCSVDKSLDYSGPQLQEEIGKVFSNTRIVRAIVPDEKILIKEKLMELCDGGCNVIFTVGKYCSFAHSLHTFFSI